MKYVTLSNFRMVPFRCDSGENLNEALEALLESLSAGLIYLPGVQAQFDKVDLGFYHPVTRTYEVRSLPIPGNESMPEGDRYSRFEPTNVVANVTWVEGKPFAHVHGAFASGFVADGGRIVGGGHISRLIVGRTCEGILLVTEEVKVERVFDPSPTCDVRVWQFP